MKYSDFHRIVQNIFDKKFLDVLNIVHISTFNPDGPFLIMAGFPLTSWPLACAKVLSAGQVMGTVIDGHCSDLPIVGFKTWTYSLFSLFLFC